MSYKKRKKIGKSARRAHERSDRELPEVPSWPILHPMPLFHKLCKRFFHASFDGEGERINMYPDICISDRGYGDGSSSRTSISGERATLIDLPQTKACEPNDTSLHVLDSLQVHESRQRFDGHRRLSELIVLQAEPF